MQRHDDAAEHIITTSGLALSLATKFGKDTDLREARGHLKAAIISALENEMRLGVEAGNQRPGALPQDDELGCPVCGETWTEFSHDGSGYATCENGHRLRSLFWRQEARKRNLKSEAS